MTQPRLPGPGDLAPPYLGPPNGVHEGVSYHLIDPMLDKPPTLDTHQHQLHADQIVVVLNTDCKRGRARVGASDGARFTVPVRYLAEV